MILSLFSGCGGLDAGFEQAGFQTRLAYDIRSDSISSWNRNRSSPAKGIVADISLLTLDQIDEDYGGRFDPIGIIGGPPCQSFTKANSRRDENDPRALLVETFISLVLNIDKRRTGLKFVVMENVPELLTVANGQLLEKEIRRLEKSGFTVTKHVLDAVNYGVPQFRKRLFLVATRTPTIWLVPPIDSRRLTVADAIGNLAEPTNFSRTLDKSALPIHPNHWCMTPKSRRFFDGSLKAGYSAGRSFKTLRWDKPSIAVSYGNREVHVHPTGTRRLSVFEAMRLQGFPDSYVLDGTLSSQITQVSEAVPPSLAYAVAHSVKYLISGQTPAPARSSESSPTSTAAE